jgi:hypothetical protein
MTAADLSKQVANVVVSVFHKDKGRVMVDCFGGVRINDGSGT